MEHLLLNCYPDPALLLAETGVHLYLNPAAQGLQQRLGRPLDIKPGQTQVHWQLPGSAEPLHFLLHWSRLQWEGQPAWMVYARREAGSEAARGRVLELEAELRSVRVNEAPAASSSLLELNLEMARELLAEQELSPGRVAEFDRLLTDEPPAGAALEERSLKLAALAAHYQARVAQLQENLPLLSELRQRNLQLEQQLGQATASQDTRRMAYQDSLTGTPNANLLMPYLDQVMESVRRDEVSACVIILEVDRWHSLLETLGREAANGVVRQLAERVREQLRPDDVLGRTQGAEFLAVATLGVGGTAGQAAAQQLVTSLGQKMVTALQPPFASAGQRIDVRVVLGAVIPTSAADSAEALAQARTALRQARLSGASFHLFGGELSQRRTREQTLLGQLRAALDEEQFALRYQPVVDLTNGRMMGAEALLRWNHPVHGLLEPGHFLELADHAGLLMEVDEWVMRQACTDIVGLSGSLVAMLNVSERQVVQSDLLRRLMKAWERTKLRAENLVLEVPESILTRDPERTEKLARELVRCKANLAIDNFGADFTSLRRLKTMSTVFVKLAPELIRGLPRQDLNHQLCRSLLGAAGQLQLHPVAKAVESAAQARCLKEMGCRFAQGRFFAPPLTLPQLKDVLRKSWKV